MQDAILITLSVLSILIIYWVAWGQRKYNDTFRTYFNPWLEQEKKEGKKGGKP